MSTGVTPPLHQIISDAQLRKSFDCDFVVCLRWSSGIIIRFQCSCRMLTGLQMSVSLGDLTHWGRDKIATISQTIYWNAFSWKKMYEFRQRCHRSLFLRFELTIFQHWFRWWLGADQATSHYLNQRWLVYWRTYTSLGLNIGYWVPGSEWRR